MKNTTLQNHLWQSTGTEVCRRKLPNENKHSKRKLPLTIPVSSCGGPPPLNAAADIMVKMIVWSYFPCTPVNFTLKAGVAEGPFPTSRGSQPEMCVPPAQIRPA